MKKATTAAPLLPAVREQAEAIRARGKTVHLPAAAEMPPVEVIRLDGTRGPADRGTQYAMMNAPRTLAWMRVHAALAGLAEDAQVLAHPAAAEFVEVLAEMARTATLADTAAEALAPVDGLLPMGARGAPFAANSGRGEGPVKRLVRKVLPALERRLKREASHREVWDACVKRRGSGITFECSPTWGDTGQGRAGTRRAGIMGPVHGHHFRGQSQSQAVDFRLAFMGCRPINRTCCNASHAVAVTVQRDAMQLRFYRLRELASVPAREDKPARQGRYPFSAATLWRWVAAGKFPAPIKINGTTAWPAEAIEAWEQAQQPAKPAEGPRKAAAASVAARRAKREAVAA